MKFATCLCLSASLSAGLSQTNLTFQNCHPGDLVKVKCDHPLLVLGRATLLEIGSNTVTIYTENDRFTLNQSEVTMLPLGSHPAAGAVFPASQAKPWFPRICPPRLLQPTPLCQPDHCTNHGRRSGLGD